MDGLGTDDLISDGVRLCYKAILVPRVPFLQIDCVCSYVNKDAIMQIDAVALGGVGEVGMVTLRRTAHRGAGRQEYQQNCNAQKKSVPAW